MKTTIKDHVELNVERGSGNFSHIEKTKFDA